MRTIAGRYELHEQVGDSSWRAADTELEREVLVRLPAGEVSGATLAHPNIVRVFDQGEEDGESYASAASTSAAMLCASASDSGPAASRCSSEPPGRYSSTAYAHAQGVTHGALGPANILFDAEGRAKVAGFIGEAESEDDAGALAVLLQILGVDEIGGAASAPEADVTAVLRPPPPPKSRRRVAVASAAAVALLAGGIGAAFLATSGDSKRDDGTGSTSFSVPTGSTEPDTQEPTVSQTTTTVGTTTEETTASTEEQPTTAPPTTTAPPPPATKEPPPTTEPPPPTTTEEPPPTTTEAPPPTTTVATTTG